MHLGVRHFIQAAGDLRMTVAQQELHAPLRHQVFAGLETVGHHLDCADFQRRFQPGQPFGEKRQRQQVGGGKAQAGAFLGMGGQRLDTRGLEVGHDLLEQRQEFSARGGQFGGVCAAVKQVRAHPFFQRAYVPAERGLRDGARFRRARKATRFGQRTKVLKPIHVQGSVSRSHVRCAPQQT
ncbi:hypothetical protein D3C73_1130090 [compost metagenome]